MSFLSEFESLCPAIIVVEPFTTNDAWGNKSYGSSVSYRGRVTNKMRRIVTMAGVDAISGTDIVLLTSSGVFTEDRITLPSGFLPRQPPILRVDRIADEEGNLYTKVYA